MVFYLVLFVAAQILPGMAFMGGEFALAITFEVPILVLFMCMIYMDYFRRCPVCGKRKVTIVSAYGGTRYATSNGVCRNCKSHVSIMYDREESKSIYYADDKYGQPHSVEPIWKTSKDKKR